MNDDTKMTFLARLVAGIIILVIIAIIYVICLALPAHPATYYVKTAANGGSDAAAGTAWNTAWATISKVNSSMGAGDTVFFATGTWWGTIDAVGGTFSDRTTYACSSFALQNGSGNYHFAKLYGGEKVEGWDVYSGNIYRATYTVATSNICFCQGDSIIWVQDNLVDITEAGEAYWDSINQYIYAYVYNLGDSGQDPDAYDMEVSANSNIDIVSGNDYITIWGLQLKYAKSKGIYVGAPNAGDIPDSIFIEHCKITHSGGGEGANAANVHFPSNDHPEYSGDYCVVRACSLAYGFDPRRYLTPSTGHGGAVSIYSVDYLLIESCQVYGYFSGDVIDFKGSVYDPLSSHNTVRYNTIRPDRGLNAVRFWGHVSYDSAYGNIIAGKNNGLISIETALNSGETDTAIGDYLVWTNNTIYNCEKNWCGGCTEYYGDSATHHKTNKYNIYFQDISADSTDYTGEVTFLDYEQFAWDVVDSNMYVYPSSKFRLNGSIVSWGTWRAAITSIDTIIPSPLETDTFWLDLHSDTGISPGFADASNGDFSRPSASGEMNLTYGGKTWTIYGAVQNDQELISTPNTPTGDATGDVDENLQYTTGGSVSDSGHTVEYRFNWNDDNYSTWSTNTSASHSWSIAGTYNITAQARCQTHTTILSASSAIKQVIISAISDNTLRQSYKNLSIKGTKIKR